MLRQLTQPPCSPVSLDEARKHLAVDASDRSNDVLINMLIESATADSQMKTGRIWVESDWEWTPEQISTGAFMEFPIAPVVGVKLYDMTPPKEDEAPELPPEEQPPVEEGGDGDNNGDTGEDNDNEEAGGDEGEGDKPDIATRRLIARQRARLMREGEITDTPVDPPDSDTPVEPEEPELPEVSADYLAIEHPSLDPMGYPAVGGITPLADFPDKYKLVLTVGYPVDCKTEKVQQFDNPVLVLKKTGFSSNLIRLVFTRPVDGNVYVTNFEIRKKYVAPIEPEEPEIPSPDIPDGGGDGDTGQVPEARRRIAARNTRREYSLYDNEGDIDEDFPENNPADDFSKDEIITLEDVYFLDGAIEIQYAEGALAEGDTVLVSFFEGDAHDEFDNFVQPIILQELPTVAFVPEDQFETPAPVPEQDVYTSLAPSPIKNWILTRVGSLYSQRTEIALRAGKSNDAMFPDQFINNLLDPYRVRFLAHVR